MKIAVYSGSFNPFHIGHLAVVRYLLERGGFDRVYLVVSPRNPFKDSSLADSGRERLDAVRRSIERNGLSGKVLVDDIEFHMSLPSYTIRTLDALQEREPRNRFTLVIGGDNLPEMLSWKEGRRLLEQYGVVVYPRSGYNMVRDCRILKTKHRNEEVLFGEEKHKPLHIKLLKDAPLVDISSSQLRQMAAEGKDTGSYTA